MVFSLMIASGLSPQRSAAPRRMRSGQGQLMGSRPTDSTHSRWPPHSLASALA
jgi:hypothetical protein